MRTLFRHVFMCLPMFLAAALLALAGAGTAAMVLALACGLMMVAMLAFAVHDGDQRP